MLREALMIRVVLVANSIFFHVASGGNEEACVASCIAGASKGFIAPWLIDQPDEPSKIKTAGPSAHVFQLALGGAWTPKTHESVT